MALRAVPDHPKFAHLKSLLRATKAEAIGYLECVWHFTARFTPRGNIGKYSDSAIESWVEWSGAAGELMEALVESGWIDRNAEHRLITHDWSSHADEMVQTTLARNCERFADGSLPKAGRLNQSEREKFKKWLEGSASAQGPVSQNQPTVRLSDWEISQRSASQPTKSATEPKPEPVPEPEPVPAPVPEEKSLLSPAEAADERLKDLGWVGVSKTPEESVQQVAAIQLPELPESKSLTSPYMIVCRLNWFEDFWAYYWRKEDKRAARVKYFQKVTTPELRDKVELAVLAQAPAMEQREMQYRKLPATWLNQECWNNDPLPLLEAADVE